LIIYYYYLLEQYPATQLNDIPIEQLIILIVSLIQPAPILTAYGSLLEGEHVEILALFPQAFDLFLLVLQFVDHDHDVGEEEDEDLEEDHEDWSSASTY
jgi:hypothetical protein